MFEEMATREIIKQPIKTAKEVEEILAKKVAETTKGADEKIRNIFENTNCQKSD